MVIRYKIPRYGINYSEGEFRLYIAVVDIGEHLEMRWAIARNNQEAEDLILGTRGGQILTTVPLAALMDIINTDLDFPNVGLQLSFNSKVGDAVH